MGTWLINSVIMLGLVSVIFLLPVLFIAACIYCIIYSKKRNNIKRKNSRKFYVPAVTLIIILPLFYIGLYFFVNKGVCGGTELPTVISSEGEYSAQVQEHDCGATSSFNTSVELGDTNGSKTTIFSYSGAPKDVNLLWINNNKLQISYTNTMCPALGMSGQSISPKNKIWNDIDVTYIDKCPLK